ncbi:NAD-dependent epimerase/dehydratase family protein [Flagellatimonas centrodinii]|uniref:NAD-dependent epimerase/dehydratase family protein n=1 Tax=Flagellatimonas centrodinii TaxID=2806210 RepID=UPI001FEEDDAA|nr:NAD-dependent epimerase/dehydratase family protein [Flagellatimonas centrodinii]ULQ47889.1 NAD-dependent epimerase/dehydratase family protein [Flagellatimonas centrodinii]
MQIDTRLPVMITGATGYVAGWVVKRLLEQGLTVHAPIRDPDDTSKRQYLDALAAELPGSIRYFKADLLTPGAYAEAMAGCQVVFHTASPFKTHVRDVQKELIEPAQLGTRNVLDTVNATASVRRVVLTSSCAAIFGDSADLATTPRGVFDETVWNTSSSTTHQPYSYSKTLAEREAWKIHDGQQHWDLVTINPALVVGPGINPFATSESFALVRQLGDGSMKPGVPDLRIGVVDVREVADAHVRAAFTPSASGRYILSGQDASLLDLADALRPRFGDRFPLPRRTLPKWLVWLSGPLVNKALTRKMVTRNMNLPWRADNRRSREDLGITYRPLAASMNDFFQQLVDSGQFNKP